MEPAVTTTPTRAVQRTALALVCATRLLDFALRMGIVPFFPELAERFNISYAAVGGIYSAFFIGYAALQLPFGWSADRWPENRLVALGLLGLGVSTLAFLHADTWQGAAAARLFMGASTAATAVPGIRLAATVFPPERRGYALGMLETAIGASNLLTISGFPLLARWVAVDSLTLAPAAATFALAAAFLWMGSPPRPAVSPPPFRQETGRADLRQVLALFLLGFLGLMALNGFLGWAPTYLREGLDYTPTAAAAAMAVALAIYVPAAYLSGSVCDRLGRRIPVINAGSLVMMAGCLGLAFGAAGPAPVYLGALLFGIGAGTGMPALITFSTEALGPARAGLATGLMQVAAQVGSAVAGVVYGAVVDSTGGFTGIWWLCAGLLAVRVVSSGLAVETRD
ncbi:MAG TPA: MFS transporter [Bacillota bacterium]